MPHSPSQPCMRPICWSWVVSMSNASCFNAGSVVWSRSQEAICTACWWCTDMSWANPTSTESAAGVEVADEPGSRISRPAAAPNSSSPTAASTAISGRAHPRRSAGGVGGASTVICIGAGASGATLAGVEPVSGSDPGVPGAGAAANGGGLSWSKAPGPVASQLAPTSGWVYWFCFSDEMNSSMRGSATSPTLSWWPQDCSETGESRPG